MTPDELKRLFPNASRSTIMANADHSGLRPLKPEPAPGSALVRPAPRKKKGGGIPSERYRIAFAVYSVAPPDWDNLAIGIKHLQDCIVEAGLLPEDDWKTLPVGSISTVKVDRKEEEKTVVIIERI